ncbi:methyltransferase family protein [Anatilimnocola floriformis]|uniref:methyltransferase family protein n=1 Tax=Anatilimnocola floriformis TaxID=2948575 RepID=UPI0020C310CB|nr:isoprenylcysteine carboxylmethyltransferase family protein [Anatilimnocola floriformis]
MAFTTAIFAVVLGCNLMIWRTRPCNLIDWTQEATILGEALLLSGLLLRAWAAGTLKKRQQIITTGPYRYVRNPLYIGSFLLMLGFSILLRDWLAIGMVLGPILAMYLNKVRQEEKYLAHHFAEEWQAYARSTPRFIPDVFARPSLSGFSLHQWARNHEYQALVASIAGLLLLFAWQRA